MEVRIHREARTELARLSEADERAVREAIAKLEALGIGLGFPHSSAVRGADRLRELRPKGGRCRLGFARAIKQAEERLRGLE